MQVATSPTITRFNPVPLDTPAGGEVQVTVVSGDTLYYADNPNVTPSNNQGSLTAGQSRTFVAQTWIVSAGFTSVTIATASAAPDISVHLAPSGLDDSAAVANAMANASQIVLAPGTFLWNSQVPAFQRNTPCKIIGAGVGKTIIRLSAAAPRAFDFNKVADGDTFTGITISDLTVDCNNVGGLHHVVIGNFQNGVLQTRFNVTGLRVSRVATINVPSATTTSNYNTATLHRLNIHVAIVDSANLPTQYSLTDSIVEDCQFGVSGGGGNEGVFLGGTVAGAVTGLNVWVDNCHYVRCTYTSGAAPTQFFASAGFQIGSCAFGGRCTINQCLAVYAGDVGFENDTLMRVDHIECEAVDCWNFGFYVRNVQFVSELQATPPTSGQAQTQAQQHTYMQCVARRLTVANMRGYRIDTFNSIPLGHFVYRDCVWDRETTDFVSTTGEAHFTIGTVASVLIDTFKVSLNGLNPAGASQIVSLVAADGAGPEKFTFHNAQISLIGQNNSGNTQSINIASVFSQTVSPQTVHVDIDGVFIDPSFSAGNFALTGAFLGQSAANTTNITGLVRRVKFNAPAAFASSWTGVNIGASSHTTINSRTGIRVTECDLSAVNGNPITIGAGNLANVFIERCGPSRTATAANYTALQTDDLIAVTDTSLARTVTLPPISSMPAGKVLTTVDESNAAATNNITISRAGSDTFRDASTSKLINTNGGTFKCYSSGSVWIPVA